MKKFVSCSQKDCFEIERLNDISLVLLPHNEVTPYATVCNLNLERGDWYNGNYFFTLGEAMENFKQRV